MYYTTLMNCICYSRYTISVFTVSRQRGRMINLLCYQNSGILCSEHQLNLTQSKTLRSHLFWSCRRKFRHGIDFPIACAREYLGAVGHTCGITAPGNSISLQAHDSVKSESRMVSSLLSQRRLPPQPWTDQQIKAFLLNISTWDTNNFSGNNRDANEGNWQVGN